MIFVLLFFFLMVIIYARNGMYYEAQSNLLTN